MKNCRHVLTERWLLEHYKISRIKFPSFMKTRLLFNRETSYTKWQILFSQQNISLTSAVAMVMRSEGFLKKKKKKTTESFQIFLTFSSICFHVTESFPSGLFHFPCQPHTPLCLLLLLLSLSLSLSHSFISSLFLLPLSILHLLTSPGWSLFLPGFSFCPPPPPPPPPLNGCTDRSLLHSRKTHHFLCAHSSLSCHLSLSLFLSLSFSLPLLHPPLFHTISLFTHSDAPAATHMLLSYITVCTCPQYKVFLGLHSFALPVLNYSSDHFKMQAIEL